MTEEETKEFLVRMRRYAISRKGTWDAIDEFPAFAWEMLEVRKWHATMKQLWAQFTRERLGAIGSAKQKVESAIHFRPATVRFPGGGERDYLETSVPAPDPEPPIPLQGLPKKDQMALILVQAGFSLAEIFSELASTNRDSKEEIRALQQRVDPSLAPQRSKKLGPLDQAEQSMRDVYAKRLQLSTSRDWTQSILQDLLAIVDEES